MAELTADAFADPPVTTDGPDGPVTVSRAVWEDSPGLLADLQREADTFRNLYPEGGES
ncbi:MAG TPA: hypothetical protein H9878_12310 [Candidatus Dietzia merdigallinarum]|nr:hypothetical protein [Candidatus Dietzia merdigallinarum]